ncbi:sigma-70 family RNA polymerase sigma factor [Paenibacillus sp. sptzw28]|nr:sigma-70 family RNA polymerase sigma factor [Paenibacillus sp. sptzw28]
MEDGELVKLARTGDSEAFGELIRRHRAKLYGYAQTITQEAVTAEDIVQDALVRAFLHMGTLVDTARFLPWLHRIVRNQAYSQLRRKMNAKEQTFVSLQRFNAGQEVHDDRGWGDMDAILHRLSVRRTPEAGTYGNPEEQLLRKEMTETITGLLRCLNVRERQIFEAHFFGQLPPNEIAGLFRVSQANVYQIISRSRRKVVQERVRVVVDQYVNSRKDLRSMKQVTLQVTNAPCGEESWTSVAGVLHRLLRHTGQKQLSFAMAMGLTGHAFRISIVAKEVHIAGPTAYDFDKVLTEGLRCLGLRAISVSGMKPQHGPNASLADPSLLTAAAMEKRQLHQSLPEALSLIHRSLDRGFPVIAWDLFMPEFSLIYGYDDGKRELQAMEYGHAKTLPYANLGRGFLEDLFVLSVEDDRSDIGVRESLRRALAMILGHYNGDEPAQAGVTRGIAAYDEWCGALRGGEVEPNGNAYNAAVVRDARRYAEQFLMEMTELWKAGTHPGDEQIRAWLGEAAELYGSMGGPFNELCDMFPFPEGGQPGDPAQSARAVHLLQRIQELERLSVALLKRIYGQLGTK